MSACASWKRTIRWIKPTWPSICRPKLPTWRKKPCSGALPWLLRKWHPQGAYYYSVEHGGFRPAPERTQGTYSKYNSIDDKIDDFFYYTTYIKYGIGRTTYDAAQEIRNEEITLEEGKALCKKFDGEYPDRFEKEIFQYLSLDRQHFPWASQLFEQPKMDREYFMHLADRFRSPHLWKWEDNMWKLRHTPYEGDSEVLWGDPKGTHHEM